MAPPPRRQRLDVYLETTAINHLILPRHARSLNRLLRSTRVRPLVSALTVFELAATKNPARRKELIDFSLGLAEKGKLLSDRSDVIRTTIQGFAAGDRRRVWRGISARIVKRRLSSPEPLVDGDREDAAVGNAGINAALDRSAELLEEAGLAPSTSREWVEGTSENFLAAKKFLVSLRLPVADVDALATAIVADEPYVRPLRAALLSTLGATGMRRVAEDLPGDPVSGMDLIHGLYLAACHVFVSEDRGQQVLARAVSDHLAHRPRVARVGEIADL